MWKRGLDSRILTKEKCHKYSDSGNTIASQTAQRPSTTCQTSDNMCQWDWHMGLSREVVLKLFQSVVFGTFVTSMYTLAPNAFDD